MRFAALVLLALFLLPSTAMADFQENFVQITCMPDLKYFALTPFALEDVEELPVEKAKAAGIYSLKQLSQKPVICQWKKDDKISVEILSYHEAQARGQCGGVESASIGVKVNGELIEKVDSAGGCNNSSGNELVITGFGEGQYCSSHFWSPYPTVRTTDFLAVPTRCKAISVPGVHHARPAVSQEAAEKGDLNSQRYLANWFGEYDKAAAAKWYRKAADQGDKYAQWNLGRIMYDEQNWEDAYFWARLAEKAGFGGKFDRQRSAEHLTAKQVSDVEKRVSEWSPVLPPAPAALPEKPETK